MSGRFAYVEEDFKNHSLNFLQFFLFEETIFLMFSLKMEKTFG